MGGLPAILTRNKIRALRIVNSDALDRDGRSSTTARQSSKPRIILGSGRSGTTWVLDCLCEANNLRPVFEPLHQNESEIGANYAYEVLTAADRARELELYFEKLSAGRVHNRWIDYRAPRGLVFPKLQNFTQIDSTMRWLSGWRKYLRRRRSLKESTNRTELLIKCIRANLMADWFSGRLAYRTVFVARHPCSVIESQLRLGKTWDPTFVRSRYRESRRLHEVSNSRYLDLLHEKHTVVEALTLNWIIENQLPIEQCQSSDYAVFFYEDLLGGGEPIWRGLCDYLGLSHTPRSDLLGKPSQQSDPSAIHSEVEFHRPAWRSRLSGENLDRIQRILDSTGFAVYDVESGQPLSREPDRTGIRVTT